MTDPSLGVRDSGGIRLRFSISHLDASQRLLLPSFFILPSLRSPASRNPYRSSSVPLSWPIRHLIQQNLALPTVPLCNVFIDLKCKPRHCAKYSQCFGLHITTSPSTSTEKINISKKEIFLFDVIGISRIFQW